MALLDPALLRLLTDRLVERMRSDLMIGFHFRNVDLARLCEFEYQHAAELLGAELIGIEVHYQGRPLRAAHAVHRVAGGHFDRRRELLRKLLVEEAIDERVAARWLAATDALRDEIVGERGACH